MTKQKGKSRDNRINIDSSVMKGVKFTLEEDAPSDLLDQISLAKERIPERTKDQFSWLAKELNNSNLKQMLNALNTIKKRKE